MLAGDPDDLEEDEAPATADAEGLRRFLNTEVLPWFETRKKELANRPLIREQAFGEALDPDKLERLGRYEVHLDRKLERMFTILVASRTCDRGRSRANPFGKIDGRKFAWADFTCASWLGMPLASPKLNRPRPRGSSVAEIRC